MTNPDKKVWPETAIDKLKTLSEVLRKDWQGATLKWKVEEDHDTLIVPRANAYLLIEKDDHKTKLFIGLKGTMFNADGVNATVYEYAHGFRGGIRRIDDPSRIDTEDGIKKMAHTIIETGERLMGLSKASLDI